MATLCVQGPLDLIRQHPEIAVDLIVGTPGIHLPRQTAVALAPTDMSAVVPVQYLADIVVIVSDAATGRPLLALVIEPQLRDSKTKRFSWPVYLTTARSITGCPAAVLVVLCPDRAQAAKCRRLIRTGHPGFDLAPIVIDSGTPPGPDGSGHPYSTLFAATMGRIDLETEAGARLVLNALASPELGELDSRRITAIIMTVASDAARHLLEAMMTTTEYQKTILDRIHEEGIAEGKAAGEAKGKAEGVLRLLDARHLGPTAEQRQQVISCTDPVQLDRWFDRAITAGIAAEVFAD